MTKSTRGPGRPPKPKDEKVNHDGIYPRQWDRIVKEARKHHMEPYQCLRWCLDDYFGRIDAEQESLCNTAVDDIQFEHTVAEYKQGK